ncbi:acyl-CoA dehydrogenase [Bacillus aquiflavi]|uniref:Acyl-CoA dehydrogenase n=1 Tax=Bacillus aquiflavi TaxID=2672567 RepID=A0A6B3VVQ5_9BACI|nr:acyl-CoA dehydrogenase family protein [Bacillus aquiflavi]MBA4535991.1 acyl-CoA dehydrogenase [Bacillus aquiflavi]NEY80365.1 acyl-CoA dehydrogenase [Bacillus aquiflavi]UAC47718.1 acyl-CoA dehydrogenase [Bacillus aquiflavi]
MFTQLEIATIKNKAHQIEKAGTLPADILQLIYEKKLFKLFLPAELGGKQLELLEALKVFQKSAAIDGNFGWLVTIGSGGNIFSPYIEENVCEILFRPKTAVIAGSGYPTGRAIKTDNGYNVSGQWKYCSGANYATVFTANCFVEVDGVLTDKIISCILMPEHVQVVQDWDAYGLKATGSHTIKVNNVSISKNFTFSLFEQKSDYAGIVNSFPFLSFSEASFTAICLGIGEDFYREAREVIERKKVESLKNDSDRYELMVNIIEEKFTAFKQAEKQFYSMVSKTWGKHQQGEVLSERNLQQFTAVCKNSVSNIIDSVNALIRYFGMEAVKESAPLNRIWRNLYTAGQHIFLTP